MPLTECPDCGGVVSDAALTCPTCHRVFATGGAVGASMAMRCGRWALVGALGMLLLWAVVKVLA
jgi:hypothetical protein